MSEKNIFLKYHKKSTKSILTLNGLITFSRTILVPSNEESKKIFEEIYGEDKKSIIPLDDFLGITNLPFKISVDLMLLIAYLAISENSFQRAHDVLLKICHINIPKETIRCVTNLIGKIVYENDCKETKETLDGNKNNQVKGFTRKGILYIETDGNFIRVKSQLKKRVWIENKVGLAFNSNDLTTYVDKNGNTCHKISSREYISYFGSIEEYKKHLFALALRNGYGIFEKTILLSDGAGWIRTYHRDYMPNSLHILDFYHVAKNIWDFCNYEFRLNSNLAKEKANRFIYLLKESQYEVLLKELEIYKDKKYPENTTVNLYTYIKNHLDSIDYKFYREQGFLIGSGAIESANYFVVQARLKGPGMFWTIDNAQYIASLRAKICSNLWYDQVVKVVYKYFYA